MNKIEKMYSNAGVKKEVIPCPAKYYGYDCTRNNWDDDDCSCDIEGYPPFTTEKQIELIKWLAIRGGELATVEINFYDNDCFQVSNIDKVSSFEAEFEQALAGLINSLWQDLTEEEKQQVRNILNE